MKNHKLQDERVIIAKRKIQSDGFQIIWIVLIISILIQQYLYNAPFTQYAVELFIFIAMSIYILIANIGIGNDIFTTEKRGRSMILINSITTGVTVTIINTMINYINYRDKIQSSIITQIILVAGITFVCSTILAFVVLKIFYTINKKRQHAINKKLNDDNLHE